MKLFEYLAKMREKWFVYSKIGAGLEELMERSYENYCGHRKIIEYREGKPVFSLTQPPVLSDPNINMLSKAIFGVIQKRSFPIFLSWAVNDLCDAACAHCSFFDGVYDKTRSVLTTEQQKAMIAAAQDLGVVVFNLVGGEPLLRDDLAELIASIDRRRSISLLFTNGSRLAERAAELKRAGLDAVFLSLDSAEAARHDARRGVSGLFTKALTGLAAAQAVGLSTGINCVVTREDFLAGEVEKLIELGRELNVKEILVFDAKPAGRWCGRGDEFTDETWLADLQRLAATYNARPDYPGVVPYSYITSHRSVGCSGGTKYFYLNPYGDVSPCDFNQRSFGNILNEPLALIYDRMSTDEAYGVSGWRGCKIKDREFRRKEQL